MTDRSRGQSDEPPQGRQQPEPQPSADAESFDVRPMLQAVFEYKWVILLVVALSTAGTFLWTARQPRVYAATCTLEYDPNPPKPLGRQFDDVASTQAYWATRELFETQDRLIASRGVAEKVVRKFSLHHDPDFLGVPADQRDGFEGVEVWEAAQQLQGRVSVDHVRDTRITHVNVTATDPEQAQLLTNAVADAYMEKRMEDRLGATASALDWLGTQLDSLKDRLEGAELALHEFSEENTELSVPLEDQKRIVAADITQLSASLTESKQRHIELAARLRVLLDANAEDPLQVHASITSTNGTIQDLRKSYGDLVTERAALAVEYGENHPKIQEVDARMEGLRQQLRAQIDDLISSARSDVEEVREVEKGLHAALADVNAAGLELNLQEITYRRLERERNNASQLYGTILERTAEADLSNAMHVSYVRLVDKALVPQVPISPRVRFNLALGCIGGLVLGLLVAVSLSRLDRTIQGVEDTEALGATVLGIMPKVDATGAPTRVSPKAQPYSPGRDLIVHQAPKSAAAECCRTIRTNLTFMAAGETHSALAVTSANPREGKTTIALSLAIAFAQSGKRVILIDTDLRRPRLHRAFGLTNSRGVTSVLVKAYTLDEAIQETVVPGLSLLACGPVPPNPSELLHREEFSKLIADLRARYDQLVFDSPPVGVVTDAAVLAPQVDRTLLVVSARQTTRDALVSTLRHLKDVRANICGAVVNRLDLSERRYGYGGSYQYYQSGDYGSDDVDNGEDHEQPAAGA